MILLWGLPGDDPFDAVRGQLERSGGDFILLDQRRALDLRIEVEFPDRQASGPEPGPAMTGVVWCGDLRIELDEMAAVYARVYDARQLRSVASADPATRVRVHEFETTLWSWIDDAPGRVVNRPSAMDSNSSKPYQAALIAECGFRVPETLITTDPDAARAFWARHKSVVYKSVSGVRSIVARLGREHGDRLDDVAFCPTQFQVYVPGVDVRVHVVGAEVFACEILCDAVDYRYAQKNGEPIELRPCQLPDDVAERCRDTARSLGLALAGLDLRCTREGEWYCFEVNPSPCFTYYEHHTGLPITAAVAAFLSHDHQ